MPHIKLNFVGIGLLLLFSSIFVLAQETRDLVFSVEEFKLNNGLQVILSEDHSLPLVSVAVAYKVGSINDKPGKAGLAYLLENLMFQGSRNISRMQHFSFINRIGGEVGADTSEERTLFFQTVPSNQLSLVLWLESDRMKSLSIDSSKIEQLKEALIGEGRSRKMADPYMEGALYFDQLLYPNFAYYHSVIGNENDLRNITADDVEEFLSTYYVPNNAIICVTGDIDRKKTIQVIKKYFETIPEGKEIPLFDVSTDVQTDSIVQTYKNSLASAPGFHLGYRIQSPYSDDYYPLKIVEYILLHGKSSRLYRRLIERNRIAVQLSGGIEIKKDLATFKIFVKNNSLVLRDRSQRAIFSEITRLKTSLVSQRELEKAKNMLRMDYLSQYSSSLGRAIFLVDNYISKSQLNDQANDLGLYLGVTPSNIIGVMSRYFTQKRIILNIDIK